MDALPYVDTLFKEYLLFRGFVNTLETFNRDLGADPGCGFQADRITELIFRKLIPGLDCQQLVEFLEHLNGVLYSRLDSRYEPLVSAVEADILRAFLVNATAAKRPDKVAEFFKLYGPQLLSNAESKGGTMLDDCTADWRDWFVLPYLPHPEREARFQAYFSADWLSLLEASFRNFLAGVMRCLPLPAVLHFNTDRRLRLALQQQVNVLQFELDKVKQQLLDATSALEQQQQVKQAEQEPQQQAQQLQQGSTPHQPLSDSISHGATPSVSRVDSQHKREASLGDWQLQLHARLHRRSTTSTDVDVQELQAMHHRALHSSSRSESQSAGSGLFELLPLGQPAAQAPTAGHGLPEGSSGTQRRHSHSRAVSSGGISFDPEVRAGAADQTVATTDDATQDSTADSHMATNQNSNHAAPIDIASSSIDATSQAGGLEDSEASSGGAATQAPASSAAAGLHSSTGGPLSSSPVMSWASGMKAAGSSSSSSSMRARRVVSSNARSTCAAASISSAAEGSSTGRPAAVMPVPLVPGALRCTVALHRTHHHQQAAASSDSSRTGVSCVAFSPSGANVASACGGVVVIWSPATVPGNAGRHAAVVCGAPVSCVAWDTRADKLMLIGCGAAGGVRAWHADTRRVMLDVGPEPGFPVVVAVAANPSEPTFVVAANSRPIPAQSAVAAPGDVGAAAGDVGAIRCTEARSASDQARPVPPLVGRLTTFNSRSFKRSSVLALPDDVGCASLAYSSTGSQLIVGTTAGTALLYEPSSRSSPLRVWQVAAVAVLGRSPGSSSTAAGIRSEAELAVQVLWRPCKSAHAGGSTSTGSRATSAAAATVSGSFLSMCAGVLCEWAVAGFSSRTPLAAVDVIAAAAATLAPQHEAGHCHETCTPLEASPETHKQQQHVASSRTGNNSTDRQLWVCHFAVSPDGCQVAALAGVPAAGVLLLYDVGRQGDDSSSNSEQAWNERPQVLLQGDMLAGGGCVCWHPVLPMLVVGCAGSSSSMTVAIN